MKKESKEDPNRRFAGGRKLVLLAALMAIITLTVLSLSIFSIYFGHPSQPKAAIIDQLSSSLLAAPIRHANLTFIEASKELLQKRFDVVDYFSDNATIDQYRNLASSNYKMILWRAHSALDLEAKYVAICSSEKYGSKNYNSYLDSGQLTLCNISGDQHLYFGITPKFVKEVMNGRFEETVIILMSCNGLKEGYDSTAEAFSGKGAQVFVSWDGWVQADDNDNAMALLLDHLINRNDTISLAVHKIPEYTAYGPPAKLRYFPDSLEVADYQIPDYRQVNPQDHAYLIAKTRNDDEAPIKT